MFLESQMVLVNFVVNNGQPEQFTYNGIPADDFVVRAPGSALSSQQAIVFVLDPAAPQGWILTGVTVSPGIQGSTENIPFNGQSRSAVFVLNDNTNTTPGANAISFPFHARVLDEALFNAFTHASDPEIKNEAPPG